MEHRYTERKPMVLDVVVVCPRVGLVRGKTVNVCMGGMFVQTTCVLMPVNAPVCISFQPDPLRPDISCEAQGMVVHQKAQGFGLMFDELHQETRSVIDVLLTGGWTDMPDVQSYTGATATV